MQTCNFSQAGEAEAPATTAHAQQDCMTENCSRIRPLRGYHHVIEQKISIRKMLRMFLPVCFRLATIAHECENGASASHPGSRGLRMRWRWPLALSRPLVVPRSRQRGCLGGPLSLLRILPQPLAALFIRAQQVHASAPLGRLRSEMFRLHVLARAAFRTRTPAGGRGPRRRCPARTSTTVPARL